MLENSFTTSLKKTDNKTQISPGTPAVSMIRTVHIPSGGVSDLNRSVRILAEAVPAVNNILADIMAEKWARVENEDDEEVRPQKTIITAEGALPAHFGQGSQTSKQSSQQSATEEAGLDKAVVSKNSEKPKSNNPFRRETETVPVPAKGLDPPIVGL